MILFLSLIGIFLSVILTYFSARTYRSSVYLGLFFFLISLYGFYQHVLIFSHSELFVRIFLFLIPLFGTLSYLIGPVVFLYIRSVLADNPRIRRSDLWHLLPAAIYFLTALPNLWMPSAEKAEAAAAIARNAGSVANYHPTLLSALVPYPLMFLSRPFIILIYTCVSIVMLVRYLVRPGQSSVFSGQSFMGKWLVTFLGSLFVLLVCHMLLLFDFSAYIFKLTSLLKVTEIISVASLTGLMVSPFFFPGILYGLPRLPARVELPGASPTFEEQASGNKEILLETPEIQIAPGDSLMSANKRQAVKFESAYLDLMATRTEQSMHEFQSYLQQDFNLAQLSVLVNIPVHHLAYYFREVKGQTFSDFRNDLRVEHAKNLIREGKSSELTLEAIGLLSGFSSRNTLLNAFKKVEGVSPQAFLAQIKKK